MVQQSSLPQDNSQNAQRIASCFARLHQDKQKAFIPFITAGYPNKTQMVELLCKLPDAGADIIEIGMPFSDPMADGPAIQIANRQALQQGMNLEKLLGIVQEFRRHHNKTPLIMMGYYNPIYRYGCARFAQDAAKAGIDGVIVVDLPPEEDEELRPLLAGAGIDMISLVTPNTPQKRLEMIARRATGFIYAISITGVTGSKSVNADYIAQMVKSLRRYSDLPIAAGFGIRQTDDIVVTLQHSDAAVVGSAVIQSISDALTQNADPVQAALATVKTLADAAHSQ